MATVWAPGTQVRIHAGAFSGHAGVVKFTDAGEERPIFVEIFGGNTSLRNYEPDDLTVVR